MNQHKMKVEIWSDIMCPFCYIGKRNFEAGLAQFSEREQIEVEWKSFQLDPTMEEVPKYQNDLYMYLADRKGFSYEQSKAMHMNLVQSAKSVGLEYKFDRALVTNSMKAHRIIQMAKTKGIGDEAEERFFRAYFTEGKNLNDLATLKGLGVEMGLTEEEVDEALTNSMYAEKVEGDSNEGAMLGVTGVPFFVVDRKYAVVGAQPVEAFLGTLEQAFEEYRNEKSARMSVQAGPSCDVDGIC